MGEAVSKLKRVAMSATCPICDAAAEQFLVRERVPANQNSLLASREGAIKVVRGSLSMHACTDCGFVFNAAFRGDQLDYGLTYENTQTTSDVFAAHVDDRVTRVIAECGPTLKTVVEVGCGKGAFLSRLIGAAPGSRGFGFDTSYEGPDSAHNGKLRFFKHYFGAGYVAEPIDAVLCRHVIEHIPDPIDFLSSIRNAVDGPHSRVFFETPCVDWIVGNQVIWDFFYEHCSYFNERSLSRAFTIAGFNVSEIHHVFGGQYLWLEGSPGTTRGSAPAENGSILQQCRAFAEREASAVQVWSLRLEEMRRIGKLAIWGAGAKGVTFAGLVDPRAELIDCVVDLNPRKQGCFIPGTGHPIVGPGEIAAREISAAILMNPNYRRENETILARLGVDVTLVE